MSRRLEYLFLTTIFSIAPALAQPIKLHPANPHYFLFNGRPTILITSAGSYTADWVDPASGKVLGTETFNHQGGDRAFNTSEHAVDIALRIKREWPPESTCNVVS